jgi:DNA-binding transcriptional ArsR family regulator
MMMPDDFCSYYQEYLDGTYDCVDRIVLNAYFCLAQSPGGFRTWWRQLMGSDETLDNTHLMRFAGRFSRRIHAYAQKQGIPLIHCQRGEDKHEIAEQHLPKDPTFRGVFCIIAGLAPAPIFHVHRSKSGAINITTKTPYPYVNHYSFHIIDPEWGHLTIKLCPHPPFPAQIILNGHEYVARQAQKGRLAFIKEGNCFTEVTDATGLARIADTMRASSSVGRLIQVCGRWIYSACLCFALDLSEQQQSGFHYSYSVYQSEYSRNLLFTRGRTLDEVFHSVIDRTRAPLNIKIVKTIFGYRLRPFSHHGKKNPPRFEVVVERPVYDLTVFKVHFGKLTLKMYSKGERVLRIEAIAHNTKQLRCGRGIDRFPQIIASLKAILERFLDVLRGVDVSFIDDGKLETWPLPSRVGTTRVGGVDINRPRIRAVLEAVVALSITPRGFTASELAEKLREILGDSAAQYQARHASYDLKKLRGKDLVRLINHSRFYEVTREGLRAMMAFLVLREKVLIPLLAGVGNRRAGQKPKNRCEIDIHYENIQSEMQKIFEITGIAA